MDKVEKIKAEIERRLRTIEPNLPSREVFDKVADRNPGINSDFNIGEKMGAYTMLKKVEQFIDSLEEEPASNDLEEASVNYAVTGEFLPNGKEMIDFQLEKAFKAGAQWQKENLWKDAQGDDLPEIDREVIVLVKSLPEHEDSLLKVSFGHRPPEYWMGKNIGTGEITRYEPKRCDKGGWNQPNVVYWLDVELPKEEE